MPNYRVLVSGEGPWMELEGRSQPSGFKVLCHVWATDPAVAANLAAQVVRAAPALSAAVFSHFTNAAPVFIDEIDEAPPGECHEPVAAFHFFPLNGGDDFRPHSFLER
ncbi:MAG: hypothetical protein SGJ19_04485 [Planctomycetia bacterium]|nr:hypothetical protein [Planctomycetia bacterium]